MGPAGDEVMNQFLQILSDHRASQSQCLTKMKKTTVSGTSMSD